jgi:hypothetical protein
MNLKFSYSTHGVNIKVRKGSIVSNKLGEDPGNKLPQSGQF